MAHVKGKVPILEFYVTTMCAGLVGMVNMAAKLVSLSCVKYICLSLYMYIAYT